MMLSEQESTAQDYTLYHLRFDDALSSPVDWQQRVNDLGDTNRPSTHQVLGCFQGLFGLANNDCFCLLAGPSSSAPSQTDFRPLIITQTPLMATLRPTEPQILNQKGVYVFRFWKIAGDHVDKAIELSMAAWKTFEQGFDTEVKGLFRQRQPEQEESMLLITWYKNLTVWEASRHPDPAAMSYFRQRQALIHSVMPIATRLI